MLTVISSEIGIFGHISHLTFKREKECCSRYLNVSLSIREFFKKMIAWGCMLSSCVSKVLDIEKSLVFMARSHLLGLISVLFSKIQN